MLNDEEIDNAESAALEAGLVEQAAIDGKDKRTRHLIVALVVLILISVSTTAWALYSWAQDQAEQTQAGAAVVSDVKAACADPALKKQLEKVVSGACATADKAAAVISEGPQGKTGEQGPPPTAAQVLSAVSIYCSGGACTPSGPTQSQVNAAVATFCSGGACEGKPGATVTGPPGATVTGPPGATVTGPPGATGEQGPGPSDEQVASAVAAYCNTNNCKGADGAKGEPGESAFPFFFQVTVPGSPPLQEDTTYLYECTTPGGECARTEVGGSEPADPDQP